MDNERLSIEAILFYWDSDCYVNKISRTGNPYRGLPSHGKQEHLANLLSTFIGHGYSKEELVEKSGFPVVAVQNKIINHIWDRNPESMSAKELHKAKGNLRKMWQCVIAQKFPIKLVKEEVVEKIEIAPKKEKALEINPKDRIVMNVSDIKDPELDLNFLKDLGIEE